MKENKPVPIPNPVTADWLGQFHSCPSELRRFRKEFPFGVRHTKADITKAARKKFDLDWFAASCLPLPALDAYEKARAPALDAYKKASAPAWDAYKKASASALYNALKGLRR